MDPPNGDGRTGAIINSFGRSISQFCARSGFYGFSPTEGASTPVKKKAGDERFEARSSEENRRGSRFQCRISHSREIKEIPARRMSTTNGRFSSLDPSLMTDCNRSPKERG